MPNIAIWVEDLGNNLKDAIKLRYAFNLPGMKVFQFAFDFDANNFHLTHNYTRNSVVYTGNHDNNTSRGFIQSLNEEYKNYVFNYLNTNNDSVVWDMILSLMASIG